MKKITNIDIFKINKIKKFNLFSKCLLPTIYIKPNKSSKYATQGCCSLDEKILLTSYDTTKKHNSKLDIINQSGNNKSLYFDNKTHVGGVSYHKISEKIYVANSNQKTISYYNKENVMNTKNASIILPDGIYNISKYLNSVSYLTIYDDFLYVGDFKTNKLVKFNVDSNGNINNNPIIYNLPFDNVQGISIYKDKTEEYFIFSSSFGRFNDSKLFVAKLNNKEHFEIYGYLNIPCMSEQISLTEDNHLLIVFESDCIKYWLSSPKISSILSLEPKKIIELSHKNIN